MSETWIESTLGDQLREKPHNGYSPKEVASWTGTLALGLGCISPTGFFPTQLKNVPSKDRRNLQALLRDGDLLITRANTRDLVGLVGRYRDIGNPCIYPDLMMRLVPAHSVTPDFFEVLLRSATVRRQIQAISQGTSESMAKISGKSITKVRLLIPPLNEQRRITEILDTLDSQTTVISLAVDKLRAKAYGIAENLLASLAVEKTPLAAHLTRPPKNGFSPKEVEEWTGLQALGLGCLTPDGFQPRQLKNVPARDGRNTSALLNDGDLLMSRANTRELVGLVGIYRSIGSPCIYPDLMMRLAPAETCRSAYLEFLLRSDDARRQIQGLAQGTSESMVKISGASVLQLRLAVPSLAEQDRILAIVDAARVEIDTQIRERRGLLSLKAGLAEDLLTGRVRVSEAEAALENL